MSAAACKKIIDCAARVQEMAMCLAGTAQLGIELTDEEVIEISAPLLLAGNRAKKAMRRLVKDGGYKEELKALEQSCVAEAQRLETILDER